MKRQTELQKRTEERAVLPELIEAAAVRGDEFMVETLRLRAAALQGEIAELEAHRTWIDGALKLLRSFRATIAK